MITVIIPTYRRPHLLRRAIESVLAQTYPHFLLCIYDNASNDGTEEVLKEYASRDKRVQYHIHPENLGSNNNWQYGFNQVNTDFFAVLSDDDLYMPTFLEEAMRSFAAYPDAGFFIGGIIFVDEKNRVKTFDLHQWADRMFYEPRAFAEVIMSEKMRPFNWAGMVFRKEVQQKYGQLRVDLLWIDTEFLLRVYKEFSAVISYAPCSIFLVHTSNISLGVSLRDFLALNAVFKNLVSFHLENVKMLDAELNSVFAHNMLQWCFQKFAREKFEECIEGTELLMKQNLLSISGKIIRNLSKICLRLPFLFKFLKPCLVLRRWILSIVSEQRLKNTISTEQFTHFSQLRR
jgi:glycosyltransferase involved in cell wall biosynthesis